MATMDDLIATVSGGMHVGQHGQDLQALQVCHPLSPVWKDKLISRQCYHNPYQSLNNLQMVTFLHRDLPPSLVLRNQ